MSRSGRGSHQAGFIGAASLQEKAPLPIEYVGCNLRFLAQGFQRWGLTKRGEAGLMHRRGWLIQVFPFGYETLHQILQLNLPLVTSHRV